MGVLEGTILDLYRFVMCTNGVAIASLVDRPGAAPCAAPRPSPPRRPPPSHDISIDDEPEIDVREHDWRFNLQQSG